MMMDYESFVAYSCITIIALAVILFFRWIYTDNKKRARQRKEFEKRHKEIERLIRHKWARRGHTVANIGDYEPEEIGVRNASQPKRKIARRSKPEWWRFLTEETIESLIKRYQQRKA